jgi:hypothetical protein
MLDAVTGKVMHDMLDDELRTLHDRQDTSPAIAVGLVMLRVCDMMEHMTSDMIIQIAQSIASHDRARSLAVYVDGDVESD